jgi:WhiB family transcriptional regulator, redox-sensing transcriptional regulator
MARREWSDQAACLGMDTNLFFEGVEKNGVTHFPKIVRETCYRCPVQLDCLNWAFENEEFGFWGGMSPKQRAKARVGSGIRLSDSVVAIKNHVKV